MEDGLRNRSLKVAREPGPSPTRVNAQLAVLLACSEPKQLAKERHALLADGPCGLKHRRTEQVVSAPEALVVLLMLPQTVRVGRAFQTKVLLRERTGDRNVHRQSLRVFPARDGDVARPPTRTLTEDEAFLKNGRQQPLLCEPKQQVPEPVVSNDDVRVRFAARGVVRRFRQRTACKKNNGHQGATPSCPGGTARLCERPEGTYSSPSRQG